MGDDRRNEGNGAVVAVIVILGILGLLGVLVVFGGLFFFLGHSDSVEVAMQTSAVAPPTPADTDLTPTEQINSADTPNTESVSKLEILSDGNVRFKGMQIPFAELKRHLTEWKQPSQPPIQVTIEDSQINSNHSKNVTDLLVELEIPFEMK